MICGFKDRLLFTRRSESGLPPSVNLPPHALLTLVTEVFMAAVLIFSTVPRVQAQPLQEEAAGIVVDVRSDAAAPALSVLLLQDDAVLARVVDGMADPIRGVEAGIDTAFPAGSVTKTLTAALVMTEVDAGRLDLDAPIAAHVPPQLRPVDATGTEVDVTLRQLLSHHSGLPVTWDGFPGLPPVESRAGYIAESRTVVHAPGERLVYSNVAFVLAGEIAAASAGMSFEELAQERLFDPLGMTRTSLGHTDDYSGPLAAGHTRGPDGTPVPEPHLDLTPMAAAGSLLTTPEDLARFATMLLSGGVFEGERILSEAAVEEMTSLQVRAHPDLDEGFGLGFGVVLSEAGRLVFWDGTTNAAASRFMLHPASGTAVIAMTNIADNQATSVVGRRLMELVVPELAGSPEPLGTVPDGIDGYYLASDFVDPDLWFLAYINPLHAETEGATVRVSSGLLGSMTLVPMEPGRFRVEDGLFDGASALATGDLMQIGFLRAERLPALLTPPALLAYAAVLAVTLLAILGLGLRAVWQRVRRARPA